MWAVGRHGCDFDSRTAPSLQPRVQRHTAYEGVESRVNVSKYGNDGCSTPQHDAYIVNMPIPCCQLSVGRSGRVGGIRGRLACGIRADIRSITTAVLFLNSLRHPHPSSRPVNQTASSPAAGRRTPQERPIEAAAGGSRRAVRSPARCLPVVRASATSCTAAQNSIPLSTLAPPATFSPRLRAASSSVPS